MLVVLIGITMLSGGILLQQALVVAPLELGWFRFDRLSALMTMLVAGVGTVCYRFSLRYLDGEPGQRQFVWWLFVTIMTAYMIVVASNLLILFLAWSGTSLGLHHLLTFYTQRSEAHPPARKKFLISRLGDLVFVTVLVLIWNHWRTFDLATLFARIHAEGPSTASSAIAVLVVIAALTKSAQFPFHSWLPETIEAPTPVSALMHAGIINAGGVLLLRFAPVLAITPSALFLLALVGTLTMLIALPAMWAQTKIKRVLAWSTVSQMSFMMIQCGVAAFPAAALHILGHGCYKAWSFLRSGELPPPMRAAPALPPQHTLQIALVGWLVAIPVCLLAMRGTGFNPLHSPGELGMAAIVVLSIGQLWVAIFRTRPNQFMRSTLMAVLLTLVLVCISFGLYQAMHQFLLPVFGELPVSQSPLAWAAVALPVLAIVFLTIVHAYLPVFGTTQRGRAWYVHALHGFYFGSLADRMVARIWNRFALRSS